MSIRLQHLREAFSFLSTFVGRVGEITIDTTNNRIQVHDGVTAGGWPAAKFTEVVTNGRTAVADANYTALASDRTIAYSAITAACTVTLPAANAYPTGTRLVVFDESGSCSATNAIRISRAGSDTIDGAASAVISMAYGYLALQSNGAGKWTIVNQAASNLPLVGIGTPADPNNPLSVFGTSALFNSAGNFNFTINKATSSNTASTIYEDGFSGRAQVGLCGDDNFHFKVSPNGSSWVQGIVIDAATGAVTLGNGRTPVSDANYTALATDRLIAYTALTVTRTVTLPAASAYPSGTALVIADESGACSAAVAIDVVAAGSDTIGAIGSSPNVVTPFGFISFKSNGTNAWTVSCSTPLGGLTLRSDSVSGAIGNPTLTIKGNNNKERFSIYSNQQPQFDGFAAGTSVDSPTAISSGAYLFCLGGHGHNGSVFSPVSANIKMVATQNWTTGANGVAISFGVTANGNVASGIGSEAMRLDNTGCLGIGTASPAQKLDVSGNIAVGGMTAVGSDRSVYLGSYTVAGLPAPGTRGRLAFASNGRMFNGAGTLEGAGAGTGGLVTDNGTAWKIAGTNQTVQA